MMRCSLTSLLVAALICGCSGSPSPLVDGLGPDRSRDFISGSDLGPDAAVPDARPTEASLPDGRPGDMVLPPAALQTVVNAILLPTKDSEFARDYDGTGPKNRLGAINSILTGAGLTSMNFQQNIDYMISNGLFLLLFEVLGHSIVDDPAAALRYTEGQDLDFPPNPTDNFSGSEQFGRMPGTPSLVLLATVTAGKLKAGPGTLMAPIPIGAAPVIVQLKKAEVHADLSATPLSAMTNGRLYGAIDWNDVDKKIIPAMAIEVDATYQSSSTPASVRDLIRKMFDLNHDGHITADELRNNGLLSIMLAADVDTDGDKTPDAMSAGMGFTAVKCSIK